MTEENLLRAALDGLLDPHVLLRPVHQSGGEIADFEVLLANQAALSSWEMRHEDAPGSRVLELLPGLIQSGIFDALVQTLESGTPTVLSGQRYISEPDGSHYFDVRAMRPTDGLLSVSWVEVTDRHLAAQAADEANLRYRLLAENASDVVLSVVNGDLGWVSPSSEAVLGWHPQQLLGSRMTDLLHPEDFAAVMSDGAPPLVGPFHRETRMRCADGGYRWMDVRAARAQTGEPGDRVWIVAGRDIDAEVATRAHLRDEQAKYEAVRRSVADAFITLTQAGTVDSWNAAAECMFGYQQDEVLGRSYKIFVPERYWVVADRWLSDLTGSEVSSLAARTHRVQLQRRDGTPFPGEFSMAVWTRGGSPNVTGILRDASRQQQVLDNLERSRAELAEAQRLAHAGSWTYDPGTGLFEWSDGLRAIYGLKPGAAPTGVEALADQVAEDQHELIIGLIRRAVQHGEEAEVEFDLRRPDGEIRRIRGRVETVSGKGNSFRQARVRGIAIDITDTHRAAEARARRIASQADYLSRVEHTLRTHLSVVEGWAGILEQSFDALSPDVRDQALGAIRRNADALVALVQGLMSDSATLALTEGSQTVPVDVAAVAASVVDDYRGLATDRNIGANPLSGVWAKASAEGVDTVVRHLVENSLHHAGAAGSVEVWCQPGSGGVEILVRNDGDQLAEGLELFRPFTKGAHSSGNGLGLHVVQSLVEAMGGRVEGRNRADGVGVEFVVTLPALD